MTYLHNFPSTMGHIWTALHRHAFRGCAEIGPALPTRQCPLQPYESDLYSNLPAAAQRSYAIRARNPIFLLTQGRLSSR